MKSKWWRWYKIAVALGFTYHWHFPHTVIVQSLKLVWYVVCVLCVYDITIQSAVFHYLTVRKLGSDWQAGGLAAIPTRREQGRTWQSSKKQRLALSWNTWYYLTTSTLCHIVDPYHTREARSFKFHWLDLVPHNQSKDAFLTSYAQNTRKYYSDSYRFSLVTWLGCQTRNRVQKKQEKPRYFFFN